MTRRRIISRLDIKGPNVIKGIQMEGLRVIGRPSELARRYYEQGSDEIVFIDTVATLYGRENLREVVELAANELFIPMTVGGGIRTLDDAKSMLMCGADKIAVNSGAIRNPRLLTDIARVFGSQCLVLSVEAKQVAPNRWQPYIDNGREPTGLDVVEWCKRAEGLGIGEILLTSVDRDGTKKGLDIALTRVVTEAVRVPVVASGGAGAPNHLVSLFRETPADGVALASALHFGLTDIRALKSQLATNGIPVRSV